MASPKSAALVSILFLVTEINFISGKLPSMNAFAIQIDPFQKDQNSPENQQIFPCSTKIDLNPYLCQTTVISPKVLKSRERFYPFPHSLTSCNAQSIVAEIEGLNIFVPEHSAAYLK